MYSICDPYDENGNLVSVTDPNSNTTTYDYDVMNRVASSTDPASNTESFVHAAKGLLARRTDRNNQVTGWTYDELERVTQIGCGGTPSNPTSYTSTITNTWDAGNRLIEADDSVSGSIARMYDDLDRLTSETTALGSVSYTYDAGGRRTTMSVSGQPTVTYTWDAANRLTEIEQAAGTINGNSSKAISFEYDNANRRTRTVFSNGVTADYEYDDADRLVGTQYAKADTTPIGNLTYSYDSAARRTAVGGTLAAVSMPSVSASASYGVNNELLSWNSVSISHDPAGNLTADGVNTYSWNDRNQLSAVIGTTNGSFLYDAFGRRIRKNIGSTITRYQYDGANFVEETDNAGTTQAVLLAGDVDEVFARMTTSGISTPLVDSQGSVVAETDSTESVMTTYTYEPYGLSSRVGTSTGFSQGYTGREEDLPALYYYRARYYSPVTARFLQTDPIGFAGGINTYAYVMGNPTSFVDPMGLAPGDSFPSAEAAAIDALNYITSLPNYCDGEYGGWVYKEWSLFGPATYTYDQPKFVGRTGGFMPNLPVFHTTAAMYHNHPYIPAADYDLYSPGDMLTADQLNIPSYLLDPTGPISRYTPVPDKPGTGNVTTVGKSPCDCR